MFALAIPISFLAQILQLESLAQKGDKGRCSCRSDGQFGWWFGGRMFTLPLLHGQACALTYYPYERGEPGGFNVAVIDLLATIG